MKTLFTIALLSLILFGCIDEDLRPKQLKTMTARQKKKKATVPPAPLVEATTIIPLDDPRLNYRYSPWEEIMTTNGPVRRTAMYDYYAQIWHLQISRVEWWATKGPDHGVASFKILRLDSNPEIVTNPDYVNQGYDQHELIGLYSPTDGNGIELIKAWDLVADPNFRYTLTITNTGEFNPSATGKYLTHGYFKVNFY